MAISVAKNNAHYASTDGVLFNKSRTVLIQFPGWRGGSYTVPDSVTNIGDSAFSGSKRLTHVTIGNGVINIGANAFWYCPKLASVTIGKSVRRIGHEAFSGCTSLTNIVIPKSVTRIGSIAFAGSGAITVAPDNPRYSSVDGVLFNKAETVLIQFPADRGGSYTVPSGVTRIGVVAFGACTNLTSITIPASVTRFGITAFSGCTRLKGVYFEGDAPPSDPTLFHRADKVTVYYRPGTRGWGPKFAGRPTALWRPQ